MLHRWMSEISRQDHLAWSELAFDQPVISPTGVFYVIFRMPGFSGEPGRGSGPGLGYGPSGDASSVFVSAEGEEWIRLVTDQRLLVEPIYAGVEKSAGRKALVLPEPGSPLDEDSADQLPATTELLAPYPNPFNPEVTISYTLKEQAEVRIAIFDVHGRRVREWTPGVQTAGAHRETWRGNDDHGRKQASGVYFIRLRAGQTEQTQRIVLLK